MSYKVFWDVEAVTQKEIEGKGGKKGAESNLLHLQLLNFPHNLHRTIFTNSSLITASRYKSLRKCFSQAEKYNIKIFSSTLTRVSFGKGEKIESKEKLVTVVGSVLCVRRYIQHSEKDVIYVYTKQLIKRVQFFGRSHLRWRITDSPQRKKKSNFIFTLQISISVRRI